MSVPGDISENSGKGILTIAVPGDIVSWVDDWDVDHRPAQLQMWVMFIGKLEAGTWVCTFNGGVLDLLELPVLRAEVLLLRQPVEATNRLKEWAEEVVCRVTVKEWVDEKSSLSWSSGRHREPALEHSEARAGRWRGVVILNGSKSGGRVPRVKCREVSLEDFVVDAALAIAMVLPELNRAAIDVWSECEFVVAWIAHAETVGIRKRIEAEKGGKQSPAGNKIAYLLSSESQARVKMH